MDERAGGNSSRQYGGRVGHAIFHWWIRRLGVGPAYSLLALLIPYYVLFRPSVRRSVAPYLKHRFPGLSWLQRMLKTIRYFYSFGQVLIDQAALGILGTEHFAIEFPGAGELYRLAEKGNGLVLLTTHAGSWQASMANMGALGVRVHFQFQLEDHTAGRHFFDLSNRRDRFNIISPRSYLGGMVELTNALTAGECVAVMGDRAWGGRSQATVFLDDLADFPVAPYHLAVLTGAEAAVLLTFRTGKCAYRIEHTCITADLDRRAVSRKQAVQQLMQRYVHCLEDYVTGHPLMWFNFFDLWKGNQGKAQ